LFQGINAAVKPATNNKNASMSRNVSSADDRGNGRNTTSHVSKLAAAPNIRSPYIGTYRPRANLPLRVFLYQRVGDHVADAVVVDIAGAVRRVRPIDRPILADHEHHRIGSAYLHFDLIATIDRNLDSFSEPHAHQLRGRGKDFFDTTHRFVSAVKKIADATKDAASS
jgi:hypothetical protein